MRLRDSGDDRHRVDFSELCETAYYRIVGVWPRFHEVFYDLCDQFERQPFRVNARPLEVFPDRNMFVHVTPRLAFAPQVRVLFEIATPVVAVWHLSQRDE